MPIKYCVKDQFVLQVLEDFVREFFDQNPISQVSDTQTITTILKYLHYLLQLGVISTKDGKAEKVLDLNGKVCIACRYILSIET